MNYVEIVKQWLPKDDQRAVTLYRERLNIVQYQGPATLIDIPADFEFDGTIVYEAYVPSLKNGTILKEHERVVLQGVNYALFQFYPTQQPES